MLRYLKKAKYERDAQGRYLVLKMGRSKKRIPVSEVGKYACDHDGDTSDDGRCWDCGSPRRAKRPKKSKRR